MIRFQFERTRVSSLIGLIGLAISLGFLGPDSLRAQQLQLPSWAKTDPPEAIGLVVDFLVQQDSSPQPNVASMAAQAGVKPQEMAVILVAAKAVAAALRAVDRELPPTPGKIDDSLFRYHTRRQQVSDAEIGKLRTQIPVAAWRAFLGYVIETTAVKEKAIRSPGDIQPIAPGAPGGPKK